LLDLDERGVELHSVERGEVDISEPWTLTIETIKATSDDVEKRKEIERSKREIEKRVENGFHQGRAPLGLKFDDRGEELVVDEDEISQVKRVLELRDNGYSYPDIEKASSVPQSTAYRVVDRREMYEEFIS
jgi:DNA invertase Pin-like site-specific DNA recombinase